jgi:phosphoribosylamine--glycine ligase
MKFLVIGGGGREYALALKFSQSPLVTEIVCAPGNGGTAGIPKCRNVDISATDISALVELAKVEKFELTVVGPEGPLVEGIVDRWPKDLRIFGPGLAGAELEGSKIHANLAMDFYNIPTAKWKQFDNPETAREWLMLQPADKPWVMKADGLCAGKGVLMCADRQEAIEAVGKMAEFGKAGEKFIIEECLYGKEASLILLCGKSSQIIPLETAQDYKRIGNGDTGPNTGGMGCFSPAKQLTPEMIEDVIKNVRPLIKDVHFVGFLYVGLMLTEEGPMILEFNVRSGDPETQVILPRLQSDLAELLYTLAGPDEYLPELIWSPEVAVTVVMAADGYPNSPRKGDVITGLDEADEMPGITVIHAGTKLQPDGKIVTNGGRVLNVTATSLTFPAAVRAAYYAVIKIDWPGVYHRDDIGEGA